MRTAHRQTLRTILFAATFGALTACIPAARAPVGQPGTVLGPPAGALVIAGGGDLHDTGIVERFLDLAGGPAARIVVIPTADGEPAYSEDWEGLQLSRRAGATNLTILHTYDREEAETEEFIRPLLTADGVWFPGGRQWRLANAYVGTRTHVELEAVLLRGGVVGGSSAGASILASFLVRGAPEGNHIVMSPGNDVGFGFLWNTAIDQHLLTRNRERDLLKILAARPELLGIGIDESTAVVVRGNSFEVIGRSRVAVYDGTTRTRRLGYYFLDPGEKYDLQSRSAEADR
jgi:cyanophycinase